MTEEGRSHVVDNVTLCQQCDVSTAGVIVEAAQRWRGAVREVAYEQARVATIACESVQRLTCGVLEQ